jgi:NAD+ diphosphatase
VKRIVFSGGSLDRAAHRRRDAGWLRERLAEDATRVLPFWRLSPLVRSGDAPRLAWATPALLDGRDSAPPPIFLGVAGGVAHFAADLSDRPDPLAEFGFDGVAHFPDLRAIAGLLPPDDACAAAQAGTSSTGTRATASAPAAASARTHRTAAGPGAARRARRSTSRGRTRS